jgi:Na+-driven multidrug efflux pump
MSAKDNELIRGGRLAKNVMWSLLSVVVPVLIAVIGKGRFGLLAISWMFVGYFSLYGFGLDRVLTVLVAKYFGEEKTKRFPVWSGRLCS